MNTHFSANVGGISKILFIAVWIISKKLQLKKKFLKNSPGKCKKSGCSHCKSENPLCKNNPSEKNSLLKLVKSEQN